MGFRNTATKSDQAAAHVSAATGLFTDAQARLDKAVDLLTQAADEHDAKSVEHAAKATAARTDLGRAVRVRDRLAEFTS